MADSRCWIVDSRLVCAALWHHLEGFIEARLFKPSRGDEVVVVVIVVIVVVVVVVVVVMSFLCWC